MEASDRPKARIVVLASGSGSNLQAIIDACREGRLHADVTAVVSNRTDAYALQRATDARIPASVVELEDGEARSDFDVRLADTVAAFEPDLVVLAGWMRILTMNFLGRFPGQVINLHPALPGELPGTNSIERAWDEAIRGDRAQTGVMVHLVPDEGVDDGPVLGSVTVPIDTSSFDDFAASMHRAEHRLLVDVLASRLNPVGGDIVSIEPPPTSAAPPPPPPQPPPQPPPPPTHAGSAPPVSTSDSLSNGATA